MNYNNNVATSGAYIQFPSATSCQNLQGTCLTFFWASSGSASVSRNVTYSYTLDDGRSGTTTASFVVNGPGVSGPGVLSNYISPGQPLASPDSGPQPFKQGQIELLAFIAFAAQS